MLKPLLNAEYLISFRAAASLSPLGGGGANRICSPHTNTKRCSIKIIRSGGLLSDDPRRYAFRVRIHIRYLIFSLFFSKRNPIF